VLTLGGRLSRHDSFVTFGGENAACGLFGAYLLRGEQEATNADRRRSRGATLHHHRGLQGRRRRARAWCVPRQDRGAAGRSEDQRASAQQEFTAQPRANVDTKPELEILADDVKCSHGATVGDLDVDALFISKHAAFQRPMRGAC